MRVPLITLALAGVSLAGVAGPDQCPMKEQAPPLPKQKCGVKGSLKRPNPIGTPVDAASELECAQKCYYSSSSEQPRCRTFSYDPSVDGPSCQLMRGTLIKQRFRLARDTEDTKKYWNINCFALDCPVPDESTKTFDLEGLDVPSSNDAIATVTDEDGTYSYALHFQPDGNLVIYQTPPAAPSKYVWASFGQTQDKEYCTPGDAEKCHLVFQGDGNLVTYSTEPASGYTWAAMSHDKGGKKLVLAAVPPFLWIEDDNGTRIWTTGATGEVFGS